MPKLGQIQCTINSGFNNIKLPEYLPRYHDNGVESYVPTLDVDLPFSVHVQSNGYIAPGLAIFVFLEGRYQCNRNVCGLVEPGSDADPRSYEIDVRLRQHEEVNANGNIVGREWTLSSLNTLQEKPQSTSKKSIHKYAILDVVILRCKRKGDVNRIDKAYPKDFPTSAYEPPGNVNTGGGKSIHIAQKSTKSFVGLSQRRPATPEGSGFGGLMGGIFDGACDHVEFDDTCAHRCPVETSQDYTNPQPLRPSLCCDRRTVFVRCCPNLRISRDARSLPPFDQRRTDLHRNTATAIHSNCNRHIDSQCYCGDFQQERITSNNGFHGCTCKAPHDSTRQTRRTDTTNHANAPCSSSPPRCRQLGHEDCHQCDWRGPHLRPAKPKGKDGITSIDRHTMDHNKRSGDEVDDEEAEEEHAALLTKRDLKGASKRLQLQRAQLKSVIAEKTKLESKMVRSIGKRSSRTIKDQLVLHDALDLQQAKLNKKITDLNSRFGRYIRHNLKDDDSDTPDLDCDLPPLHTSRRHRETDPGTRRKNRNRAKLREASAPSSSIDEDDSSLLTSTFVVRSKHLLTNIDRRHQVGNKGRKISTLKDDSNGQKTSVIDTEKHVQTPEPDPWPGVVEAQPVPCGVEKNDDQNQQDWGWENKNVEQGDGEHNATDSVTSDQNHHHDESSLKPEPCWLKWNKSSLQNYDIKTSLRSVHRYRSSTTPALAGQGKGRSNERGGSNDGADYTHRVERPEYLDSMDSPYTIFRFKFRNQDVLEKRVGREIKDEISQFVSAVRVGNMKARPKYALIEELIQKSERGETKDTDGASDQTNGEDNHGNDEAAKPQPTNPADWNAGINNQSTPGLW